MDRQDCIFCKIARGDMPASIVYQDAEVVVFKDIHPSAPIHYLIIPRIHLDSAAEAEEQHAPLLGKLIVTAAKIAHAEGFATFDYRLVTNIGRDGGQSVFHLHWHLMAGRRMTWPSG
ncbi:MAG: histidine triad nucleotide-binding protein [Anaerolinea sp.]|nr:histidine triad nucleotide-binding protein [Anaerolinea sp.]